METTMKPKGLLFRLTWSALRRVTVQQVAMPR